MNEQDIAQVYATLLCSPGMNEPVKIDHKISRKTILLLSQIIQASLPEKTANSGLADQQSTAELRELISVSLEKAGLTALSVKLGEIHP